MTPRQEAAMRQALGVLRQCLDNPDADDAITALREALAEQATEPDWKSEATALRVNEQNLIERQAGEPVAHLWQHSETGRTRIVMPGQIFTADANWFVVGPLQLATTQQPLTDDVAKSLCKVGPVYAPDGKVAMTPLQYRNELEVAALHGLRKGERAHGITGSKT